MVDRSANWDWAHLETVLPQDTLFRRDHLILDCSCPVCTQGEEDLDHVLRRYGRAKAAWVQLLQSIRLSAFFTYSFEKWFEKSLRESGHARAFGNN
ncbi:hypothetical protein V6N11_075356 [Hibiscus sabdariffa]|uniref:Uncharacterized protein n=1 Tax=Hibiscus sabdariffa TaxID=183260 RepID=A0ABR2R6G1_9ROSI